MYVEPSNTGVHARRLREKIEEDPSRLRHIETVWGVGYRWKLMAVRAITPQAWQGRPIACRVFP